MWVEEDCDTLLPWINSVVVGARFGGNSRTPGRGDQQQVGFPRSAAPRVFAVLMDRCRVDESFAPTLLQVGACVVPP